MERATRGVEKTLETQAPIKEDPVVSSELQGLPLTPSLTLSSAPCRHSWALRLVLPCISSFLPPLSVSPVGGASSLPLLGKSVSMVLGQGGYVTYGTHSLVTNSPGARAPPASQLGLQLGSSWIQAGLVTGTLY